MTKIQKTLLFLLMNLLISGPLLAAQPEMIFVSEESKVVKPWSLVSANSIDLLKWNNSGKLREAPAVPYERKSLFGKWIHYKKSPGCYDVRAQVLVRESKITAISTDDKPCTIEKGEWQDPYSGKILTTDDEVQIDHMVPLKEAYDAGAYAWTQSKRCVYANFLGMKDHLIAGSNFENQSKSDKTPEKYIPPLKEYVCTYPKNWLT